MTPEDLQKRFDVYLVGGAVRDRLLRDSGIEAPGNDRDWVVVGATEQDMIQAGFLPVGADFPVFLHPETHEEYALARTERKCGHGYRGFVICASPDVSLECDLARRDLTINAMAMDAQGNVIDPYGGCKDLCQHIFRHVSAAFCEDPVRILRVARFSARLPSFSIAPETLEIMRSMVRCGETDALVPERVWAECERALDEPMPSRFFSVLLACGYWQKNLPGCPIHSDTLQALDRAAKQETSLVVRACIAFSSITNEQAESALLSRMKLPTPIRDTARLYRRVMLELPNLTQAQDYCRLFDRSDILRRPERFKQILQALTVHTERDTSVLERLSQAFRDIDAGAIAQTVNNPKTIAQAIAQARIARVQMSMQAS